MAHILVVDDDPDLIAMIETQLRHHGHDVSTVFNGDDAIDFVKANGAPDVAILDIAMPGMNGFDLFKVFRAIDYLPTFPVIFLSARAGQADVDRGIALDGTYMTKPYEMSALLDAVDRALKRRTSMR
jgi:DNA-binding response OmpR family regulator